MHLSHCRVRILWGKKPTSPTSGSHITELQTHALLIFLQPTCFPTKRMPLVARLCALFQLLFAYSSQILVAQWFKARLFLACSSCPAVFQLPLALFPVPVVLFLCFSKSSLFSHCSIWLCCCLLLTYCY